MQQTQLPHEVRVREPFHNLHHDRGNEVIESRLETKLEAMVRLRDALPPLGVGVRLD
jgi:hypothetical protein